jgi:hypothetical protein
MSACYYNADSAGTILLGMNSYEKDLQVNY